MQPSEQKPAFSDSQLLEGLNALLESQDITEAIKFAQRNFYQGTNTPTLTLLQVGQQINAACETILQESSLNLDVLDTYVEAYSLLPSSDFTPREITKKLEDAIDFISSIIEKLKKSKDEVQQEIVVEYDKKKDFLQKKLVAHKIFHGQIPVHTVIQASIDNFDEKYFDKNKNTAMRADEEAFSRQKRPQQKPPQKITAPAVTFELAKKCYVQHKHEFMLHVVREDCNQRISGEALPEDFDLHFQIAEIEMLLGHVEEMMIKVRICAAIVSGENVDVERTAKFVTLIDDILDCDAIPLSESIRKELEAFYTVGEEPPGSPVQDEKQASKKENVVIAHSSYTTKVMSLMEKVTHDIAVPNDIYRLGASDIAALNQARNYYHAAQDDQLAIEFMGNKTPAIFYLWLRGVKRLAFFYKYIFDANHLFAFLDKHIQQNGSDDPYVHLEVAQIKLMLGDFNGIAVALQACLDNILKQQKESSSKHRLIKERILEKFIEGLQELSATLSQTQEISDFDDRLDRIFTSAKDVRLLDAITTFSRGLLATACPDFDLARKYSERLVGIRVVMGSQPNTDREYSQIAYAIEEFLQKNPFNLSVTGHYVKMQLARIQQLDNVENKLALLSITLITLDAQLGRSGFPKAILGEFLWLHAKVQMQLANVVNDNATKINCLNSAVQDLQQIKVLDPKFSEAVNEKITECRVITYTIISPKDITTLARTIAQVIKDGAGVKDQLPTSSSSPTAPPSLHHLSSGPS